MPDLDHRYMRPPFLRVVDKKETPGGDRVYLWDLRIAQPNATQVVMPVVHSLEHFLNSYFRGYDDTAIDTRGAILNIAPMGCQTGFYVVAVGIGTFERMSALIAEALEDIVSGDHDEVPLADPVRCGWAGNHSLAGVRELAAWLLRCRGAWDEAGGEPSQIA